MNLAVAMGRWESCLGPEAVWRCAFAAELWELAVGRADVLLAPERATGIVEAEGLLPSGGSSVVSISQLFLALAFVFPHSMQRVSRKRSDPESEGNREAQRITRSSHQRFSLCCLLDARSKLEFLLWKRGRDVLQSRSLLRLSGSERRRSSSVYFFHCKHES